MTKRSLLRPGVLERKRGDGFVVLFEMRLGQRSGWRVAANSIERYETMMTYQEARDAIVTQLRLDATAHDAEQYDAVGRRFDALEHRFPRGTAPELGRLHIALTFWDG